jgi:hypothetical protein
MDRSLPKVKTTHNRSQNGRRTPKTFLFAVLALFLLLGVLPAASDAKTLTMGHTVPPTHVWHQVAEKFAENLDAASQGKMQIKVVPLQKLGNEPQMFSMAQSGAIAFTILPAALPSPILKKPMSKPWPRNWLVTTSVSTRSPRAPSGPLSGINSMKAKKVKKSRKRSNGPSPCVGSGHPKTWPTWSLFSLATTHAI